MKLSQLKTDEAADVLCEITEYATEILSDETLMEKFGEISSKGKYEGKSAAERLSIGVSVINEIVPYLLKEKKNAVFHILAALERKDVEEVKEQSIIETIKQIKEAAKDKELIQLFQ